MNIFSKYFCYTLLLISLHLNANEHQKVRIACIGNSITYGFGLKKRNIESYPAILQKFLGNGYKVGNFGVSARTLIQKGDHPYMQESKFRMALEFNPDIVTIKLGTNDSKPNNWKYHEDFKRDLNILISKFDSLPSHPRIFLCFPIPSNHVGWGISDSIIVNGIIPYIEEVALERKLTVIDLHSALLPYYPDAYIDGVHPDKQGNKIIAEILYKMIKE